MKKLIFLASLLLSSFAYGGTRLLHPTNAPNSSTLPSTCSQGDVYIDTSKTSGQQWYVCESANNWVQQGGSGSGGVTVYPATSTILTNSGILTSTITAANWDQNGAVLYTALSSSQAMTEPEFTYDDSNNVLTVGNLAITSNGLGVNVNNQGAGIISLSGVGGSNNEYLYTDLESTANQIDFYSTSGVTTMTFTSMRVIASSLSATALDCTGNANGGAITTDANGNFVCSDDNDSGAGTGTSVYPATSTALFNSGYISRAISTFTATIDFSSAPLESSHFYKYSSTGIPPPTYGFRDLIHRSGSDVNRYRLSEFTTVKASNNSVSGAVGISGAAYVPEIDLILAVDNNDVTFHVFKAADLSAKLGEVALSGFGDPEGLEYLWTIYDSSKQPVGCLLAISEEQTNEIVISTWQFTNVNGTITKSASFIITASGLWTPDASLGMESITYDPFNNNLIVAKQGTDMEIRVIPFNGTFNPAAYEPFDAQTLWSSSFTTINDLSFDMNTRTCIGIADQTGAANSNQDIFRFDCYTGELIEWWDDYVTDLGFNTTTWPQSEGIAITPDGRSLYVTSEGTNIAWLQIAISGSGAFTSSGGEATQTTADDILALRDSTDGENTTFKMIQDLGASDINGDEVNCLQFERYDNNELEATQSVPHRGRICSETPTGATSVQQESGGQMAFHTTLGSAVHGTNFDILNMRMFNTSTTTVYGVLHATQSLSAAFGVGASTAVFTSTVSLRGAVLDSSNSAGNSGQVYTSNGNGSAPTWQSAGTGDMILASSQTSTGSKIFQSTNTFSSTTTFTTAIVVGSPAVANAAVSINPVQANRAGLVVTGVASQSADIVDIYPDNSGSPGIQVTGAGVVNINPDGVAAWDFNINSAGVTAFAMDSSADKITVAADAVFTGTVTLPVDPAQTLTGAGMIRFDPTDNVYTGYDGSTEFVIAAATKQFTVTISSDTGAATGWDSQTIPIWEAPADKAVTIRSVRATVLGGTSVTYNIEERAYGSLGSAGTDIYSSDQAADADGEIEIAFSNSGIAAAAHLVFTTGSSAGSGAVNFITITVYYSENVE